MSAIIKINLEDELRHEINYGDTTESCYDTNVSSLIYDEAGNVIASDEYTLELTSEYVETPEKTIVIREESDDVLIRRYLNKIKYTFEQIEKYKNIHDFWLSMQNGYCDREDIEYNEYLWYQYKPLYDLLKNKGYDLELKVA